MDFPDSLISSLDLLEISRPEAERVFRDPTDTTAPIVPYQDIAFGLFRRLTPNGNANIGIAELDSDGSVQPQNVFPVPSTISAERSPWGAFRELCHAFGLTMSLGEKESRLIVAHRVYRPITDIFAILPAPNPDAQQMITGFHFKRTETTTQVALAFALLVNQMRRAL